MQPEEPNNGNMTLDEANRLLELSRQARWSFPTSRGRPITYGKPEEWVEKMDGERDRFAKAVAFFMANGNEDHAADLAARVWRLWVLARDEEGGRRMLAPALEREPERQTKAMALALYGDSLLAFRLGNLSEARKAGQRAMSVAASVGDPEALVLANLALSRVDFDDGDFRQSQFHSREARRLARSLAPEYDQAPLSTEALATRMLGDYDRAASLFRESVELNRRIDNKQMVVAELSNLGFVDIHRDRVDDAERSFKESDRVYGAARLDDPYDQGMSLLANAMIAYRRNKVAEARALLSKAKSIFAKAGLEPGRDDKFEFDWLYQRLERTV